MKPLLLTLVFQFLILTVCASELSISDSVSTKNSTLLVNDKIQDFDPDFEKLNIQSDTTKKDESNLEENKSTNEKQKKPKKNRGKLLAVLTFLSGGLSLILSMIAVVMGMTHSAGTLLVLGIGFGLAFSALLLGYFAFKKLKEWTKGNNHSPAFHYVLASMGIYGDTLKSWGFCLTLVKKSIWILLFYRCFYLKDYYLILKLLI